ncbi:MAG: FmdB family zinc ribbon protein, partial [Ilumatobacteraceae bacterium]
MPTYVYRFIDTGETIEVRQSFDEPALTEAPHPSDGKPRAVKKVFTPVGVTFKGSGFYKTDSSSGSSKSSSSSSSTADSNAGTKTGGATT